MTKDRFERRAYRRSPGREYGYDYDPLRNNRNGSSSSGKLDTSMPGDRWPTRGETASRGNSRSGLQLAQRPDPRRTRQLLRQSILAGKFQSEALQEAEANQQDDLMLPPSPRIQRTLTEDDTNDYNEQEDSTLFSNRYRARNNRAAQPPISEPEEYAGIDEEQDEGAWNELDFVDPDAGYEDPYDHRPDYAQSPSLRSPAPRTSTTSRRLPDNYARAPRRNEQPAYDDEYDEYAEEDRPRRKSKKQGPTRRKLLVGLGIAAAGGVAAYELGPKIPQALNDVGTNIEHQIQDSYNKGLAAGAEAVRKDFINALDNLEGVSLSGAMAAARLTRLAYDVFVSPLVTLATTITGDFLNVILQSLIIGRGWLARINQDNSTLAALQTVLESWVKQIHQLPKELQTITDADLDGAQAYLRGVQRKIQEEQAKLNNPSTPTPASKTTRTPGH